MLRARKTYSHCCSFEWDAPREYRACDPFHTNSCRRMQETFSKIRKIHRKSGAIWLHVTPRVSIHLSCWGMSAVCVLCLLAMYFIWIGGALGFRLLDLVLLECLCTSDGLALTESRFLNICLFRFFLRDLTDYFVCIFRRNNVLTVNSLGQFTLL